jgi:hypothetical protein
MMDRIENLVDDSENTVLGTCNLFGFGHTLGVQRMVAASTGDAVTGRAAVDARGDDDGAHSRPREGPRQSWWWFEANHEDLSRQG